MLVSKARSSSRASLIGCWKGTCLRGTSSTSWRGAPRAATGLSRPGARVRTRWDFSEDPHAESGALHAAISAFVLHEAELQALEQTACLMKWMSGEPARDLHRDFKMTRERLRTMGGHAAWLLQTLVAAAKVAGVESSRVRFVRDLAIKAQHGLPAELAALATLRPIGVSREILMQLRQRDIVAPDDLLEADPDALQPALSPRLAQAFKEAILRETAMSVRRKRTGHLRAAGKVGIPPALIEILYTATGTPLEEAVHDAFQTAGLAAKRMVNQPHGEEDIQVATAKGTVLASATGSQDDQKPIQMDEGSGSDGAGGRPQPGQLRLRGSPPVQGPSGKERHRYRARGRRPPNPVGAGRRPRGSDDPMHPWRHDVGTVRRSARDSKGRSGGRRVAIAYGRRIADWNRRVGPEAARSSALPVLNSRVTHLRGGCRAAQLQWFAGRQLPDRR